MKKLRILLAKAGLDGHDRGIKIIARSLKEAGVEVVYTGIHQTPEQVVNSAIQEDVNGIGISVLSGAHIEIFRKIMNLLKQNKIHNKVVFGGGIIPDDDIPKLKKIGVAEVFTPGTPISNIIKFVNNINK